jgi:hypothetical protein
MWEAHKNRKKSAARSNAVEGNRGSVAASEPLRGLIDSWKNRLSNLVALCLEVIEEALRPHKFRAENSEAEQHHQQPGRRRENQHDAKREQRKADYDLQPPFRLFDRLDQHRRPSRLARIRFLI